jgi:cell division protein FtsI (penicillin-binding protein 3)
MAVEDKHISYRVYLVAFGIFGSDCYCCDVTFSGLKEIVIERLAKERTVKNFVIL